MAHILYNIVIFPVEQLIEFAFNVFYSIFNNHGIAVLGVSFTVTIACLPLYAVAERWQRIQREKERILKPAVDNIKAVFKGDKQYMLLSTLYRQNQYHPLMALRSSFGILIQIPFFFAAYGYLSDLEMLKGVSFLFIRDMGQADGLISLNGMSINVLPAVMTAINIFSGLVYTKDLGLRDKIQIYGLAGLFLVILYNSPAGLVLYWTMNQVFSLIKNCFEAKNVSFGRFAWLSITAVLFITAGFIVLKRDDFRILNRCFACLYPVLMVLIPVIARKIRKSSGRRILKTGISVFGPSSGITDRNRNCIFLISCLVMAILTGLVIPSLTVASSVSEFADIEGVGNPAYYVWNALSQSAGFFCFWAGCVYFLYSRNKKLQQGLMYAAVFLAVSSTVNAFIFTGNYGTMISSLNFDGGFHEQKSWFLAVNFMTVILLIPVTFLVTYIKPKISLTVMALLFFAFTGMGCISMKTVYSEYGMMKTSAVPADLNRDRIEKVFHLAKASTGKKNVVIFMMDRGQGAFIESIFGECPELYRQYEGFTRYGNVVSFQGNTLLGVPGIHGGYEYTPEEMNRRADVKRIDKHNQALLMMPRIFTEQADFTAVEADPSWAGYSVVPDLSIYAAYDKIKAVNLFGKYNSLLRTEEDFSSSVLIDRNMLWSGFFRISPVRFRRMIYDEGKYWSLKNNSFFNLSVDFFNRYPCMFLLKDMTSFSSKKDSYICITNEMCHDESNCRLQAPDFVPVKEVTVHGKGTHSDVFGYDVNAAALKRIGEWLEYLKSNDCYDNTRIIIVSDHGAPVTLESDFPEHKTVHTEDLTLEIPNGSFFPYLLVKDFNSRGKLKTDMTFMTTADVPVIAMKGVIKNPVNPFTGTPVTDELKKHGAKVVLNRRWSPFRHHHDEYLFTIKEEDKATVRENIFDPDNWTQGWE